MKQNVLFFFLSGIASITARLPDLVQPQVAPRAIRKKGIDHFEACTSRQPFQFRGAEVMDIAQPFPPALPVQEIISGIHP